MKSFSRRKFLRQTSVAVGMAGAVAAVPGLPASLSSSQLKDGVGTVPGNLAEPLVAHVRDLKSGEIDVFVGTKHVTTRDPHLAARIFKAIS